MFRARTSYYVIDFNIDEDIDKEDDKVNNDDASDSDFSHERQSTVKKLVFFSF